MSLNLGIVALTSHASSDQGRWNQVLRHLDGDMVQWEIHVDNAAQEDVVADSQ
jgi:hypothetical protein